MILKCEDVSIRYITGDFKDIGLKEYVLRRLTGNYRITEFWADRHISFELQQGDMLGIIGTNGAGKSTLLKAISGIMVPTEGSVACSGKISALLELASGFDGDLTVRENTYLRGAMLGYTKDFMDATYGDIIDFAELRDFQDRPFKQLSSGMKSRLAFSIASLVDPEILILDEVLSVGDGAFRAKSEKKMREIISGGATTILVSHSLEQVRDMCSKILWLDKGQQVAFGNNVQDICDAYQVFLDTGQTPDEMPPQNIEPQPEEKQVVLPEPGPEEKQVVPSEPRLTEESGTAAPVPPEALPAKKKRKLPKPMLIFLAALLILTAAIIFSEANMPRMIRNLPAHKEDILYDSGAGVEVCLLNNHLYFYAQGDSNAAMEFFLRFYDDNGTVTNADFSILDAKSEKYSSGSLYIAEVDLTDHPDCTKIEFGQSHLETQSDGSVQSVDSWTRDYTP